MLVNNNDVANIAVKDLGVARRFYETTLGLTPVDVEDEEQIVFNNGNATLHVHRSPSAGIGPGTAVTWSVGEDIDDVVAELGAKGVVFEHYDLPGLARLGDLHVAGAMKAAWCKDPDGNIISIVN